MFFQSLLGDTLVKNDGTEIKTEELSSEEGAVIGLYFSAHWCPPCRGFTPVLGTIYNDMKSAGHNFEIVFISSDQDEGAFKSYHGEMPWLALPYSEREKKQACSEKYSVRGIPTLVLLNGANGETISENARSVITDYGAAGFPFTEARLAECEKEKLEKKEKALKEIASLSFLAPLTTIEHPESEVDLQSVTRSSEALAFAFMKGSLCQGSSIVLPKLIDIQNTLGNSKLSIILVPMEDVEEFDESLRTKMKNIPMIKYGERSKEVAKTFEAVLSNIDPPHVFVVAITDEESTLKIYAENAARDIYYVGADGFPWSKEVLDALRAKEEALKEEKRRKQKEMEEVIKSKQKDLEFFASDGQSHVVGKNGDSVSLTTLQSKDVVGVYFSAHWCGPCRSFTPKLIELYNKCREQDKSFEVVFASSDNNETEFNEYYAEMPWCTLSFSERVLEGALSNHFNVDGIPTLVLLKGNGELITEEGRQAVTYGVDYFPWGEEEMKRGEAEKEERDKQALEKAKEVENQVYCEQEKAKKIVIRRHIGSIEDVKISVDHNVEFDSFTTVAAPSAVVPNGKKAWYEVTFKKGSGISQFGWATSEFKTFDDYKGEGVGDCSNSYGFDGQRTCKWHNGDTSWGKSFAPENNRVLGIAADLENGQLLFSLDGDWNKPMGVAFEDIKKDIGLFPALTASNMEVFVNFGYTDFKYAPPDPSFEKMKDVVEMKEV